MSEGTEFCEATHRRMLRMWYLAQTLRCFNQPLLLPISWFVLSLLGEGLLQHPWFVPFYYLTLGTVMLSDAQEFWEGCC